MINEDFRCNCPVTSALDLLGDKWSLVIIKQMLLQECRTFKDFSESTEAIAPNILSARLKKLEKFKFIEKRKIPQNKKINILSAKQLGIWLNTYLELKKDITDRIKATRAKDYSNQFRKMVYLNDDEMNVVIGKLDDNSFINTQQTQLNQIIENINTLKQRLKLK